MGKEVKINYEDFVPDYLKNSSKFYMLITDMNGNYAYVNKYFLDRFSFITKDFIGKPSSVAIYEEDNNVCNMAVAKLMSSPKSIVPVRVRKPSDNKGGFFWSDWEFSFVFNGEGAPVGVYCVGVDVSDIEVLEKENQLISNEIEDLINSMKDAYFSLNTHWLYTNVNQVFLNLLGKKEEEVIGKSFWSVYLNSESEKCYDDFLQVMNDSEPIQCEDYYPEIKKYLNAFAYRRPKGISVFLFDVTKDRERQLKIESQNNILEKIISENKVFSEVVDQVAIVSKTDLRGNITYANNQFLRWSKYSKDEIIGKNHRILKSGKQDDSLFIDLWKKISSGNIFRGEILNKDKEGGYYWVDTIIAPVLNASGIPKEYFAIRFVINDRKENEQKMKDQNEKLKKITWQQSHELRRPLANIQGLTQLLEMESKEHIDADIIHNLLESTKQLDEIIHEITKISK